MMELTKGQDGLPLVPAETMAAADYDVIGDYRRATPLTRFDANRIVVLRARDVIALSTDPRLMQTPGDRFVAAMQIPEGYLARFLNSTMLMANGPEHTRLRAAFSRTFAHPVIRAKRSEVRAVADRIVADLPHGVNFDFLTLCASRLPAEVIAEVLGLPVDSSAWFAGQVYALSRCLSIPYDLAHHADIEAAAETLYHFTADALDERRRAPCHDLLSSLVQDDSAKALEPETLIHQVMTIILAGSDTTRAGFNMLVGRLLSSPELWHEVNADRSLIPAAVEEALRIEPPVGSLPRFVAAPIEISGCPVAAGQLLSLSTLSAMRDETCHAKPEDFDLRRSDHTRPHPVFGGGAHRCLGEMLARIEMEEGLAALMDTGAEITLVEAPHMLGFSGIRRTTPMVVRLG